MDVPELGEGSALTVVQSPPVDTGSEGLPAVQGQEEGAAEHGGEGRTVVDFSGLLLSPAVVRGLTHAGYLRPSPIQLRAIPIARCGVGN
jgi:hypothetical protein